MLYANGTLVVALIAAALPLAACDKIPAKSTKDAHAPARVEKIYGMSLHRVVLTEKAAARLDVRTAPIRIESAGSSTRKKGRIAVPYSSVFYDTAGGTWVFTNPEPLTYVRHSITIDKIVGDDAFLKGGPPAGTEVVTVAVAELYGFEKGVGH